MRYFSFWRMALKLVFSILLASLFVGATSSPADTPATTQWLVTSVKATGAGGEDFVSSVRIVNPNPSETVVDVFFLPASSLDASNSALGDNSNPARATVSVQAGRTLAIDDILASKFSTAGAGGLRFESRLPVSVLSQTLNVKAQSASGVPGTFGFSIPAQTADQSVSVGDTAYVPYISAAPDGAISGYRTNLFLLSTNASTNTVVTVRLTRGDGSPIGEADYTLGKGSQTQINRIARGFGYATADTNLTAWVTVKSGGPVLTGASVVDNAIGSISYTPPFKVFVPNNGAFGLVFVDNGYDSSFGRLDIISGSLDYLAASLVLDGCPSPNPYAQSFPIQIWFSTSQQNTTSSKNPDGSFSITGASGSVTWSGTISGTADGALFGTITFSRPSGSAGTTCPGVSRSFSFKGARTTAYSPAN